MFRLGFGFNILVYMIFIEDTKGLGLTGATSVSRVGGGSRCMLFFTGGSNLFQSNIYREFIEALESKDIDVYDVPFNYLVSQQDIHELNSKYNYDYDSVNVLGHSSGCTTMLNQCSNLHGIKDVFLLDPVNTNFIDKSFSESVGNYHSLSFIHAMKSFKITFDPFGLPFIPLFRLNAADLDIDTQLEVNKLDIENYGHSDILNQPLSDFMHNTRLSVGNRNRGAETKQKYFDTILAFILSVMN